MTGGAALSALTLLIAAVQCAFGNYATLRLQAEGFSNADIGYAVSIGALSAMATQIPAGLLVDRFAARRTIAGLAILLLGMAAGVVAFAPEVRLVFAAFAMQGASSALLGAAVTALTLGVSGEAGFAERVGLNARSGSIGNALGAAAYGFLPYPAALGLAALICAPALASVFGLPPGRVRAAADAAGAEGAGAEGAGAARRSGGRVLSRGLAVFTGASALFFLGNAALVPFALLALAREGGHSEGAVVTATVLAAQAVVALVSPAIGRAAGAHGRKPLLLLGFCMLPVRAALLATVPGAWPLVGTAFLDGVSGAVVGVLVPLVAKDLSRGNGRLTLTLGVVGLAMNLGAAASSALAGVIADTLGLPFTIVVLGVFGVAATAVVALLMPETRVARTIGRRTAAA